MEMWDVNPAPKPFIYLYFVASLDRSQAKASKSPVNWVWPLGSTTRNSGILRVYHNVLCMCLSVNVEASRERDLARWSVGTWTMVDRDLIWKMKGYKVIHETSHSVSMDVGL